MQKDVNIYERIATLESELRQAQRDVDALQARIAWYDKIALKWGGICMLTLAAGALAGGHYDKLKEKIIALFLS